MRRDLLLQSCADTAAEPLPLVTAGTESLAAILTLIVGPALSQVLTGLVSIAPNLSELRRGISRFRLTWVTCKTRGRTQAKARFSNCHSEERSDEESRVRSFLNSLNSGSPLRSE